MRSKWCRFLIAACVLPLVQCSTPPASLELSASTAFDAPSSAWTLDPLFRMGMTILSGFDEPRQRSDWEPDDWVLLGIKVARGEETDVWFVRISTLPPRPSTDEVISDEPPLEKFKIPFSAGSIKQGTTYTLPVGRVRVEAYDRNGKFLQSSVRIVPQSAPTPSLYETCHTLLEMTSGVNVLKTSSPSDASVLPRAELARISGDGLVTLTMALRSLGGARALTMIRDVVQKEVVREPSILGLLLRGLRINLHADFTEGHMETAPWSEEATISPRYRVKSPVYLSGQHLFDCQLLVGPPLPPYHLTAGVLQLEAVHPDKPQNRLTVQVLAAKHMNRSQQGLSEPVLSASR